MRRGDIVTVALPGDFGKPRPAIVIETDRLPPTETVLICLVTSALRAYAPYRRHRIEPSATNGLRVASEAMVDKVFAIRRGKCGQGIGSLDRASLDELTRKLSFLVGLAD